MLMGLVLNRIVLVIEDISEGNQLNSNHDLKKNGKFKIIWISTDRLMRILGLSLCGWEAGEMLLPDHQ